MMLAGYKYFTFSIHSSIHLTPLLGLPLFPPYSDDTISEKQLHHRGTILSVEKKKLYHHLFIVRGEREEKVVKEWH